VSHAFVAITCVVLLVNIRTSQEFRVHPAVTLKLLSYCELLLERIFIVDLTRLACSRYTKSCTLTFTNSWNLACVTRNNRFNFGINLDPDCSWSNRCLL